MVARRGRDVDRRVCRRNPDVVFLRPDIKEQIKTLVRPAWSVAQLSLARAPTLACQRGGPMIAHFPLQ